MSSDRLKEELAQLIADALTECWERDDEDDGQLLGTESKIEAEYVAERLVSAFTQVGWWNGGLYPISWSSEGMERGWEPVYRFVRPVTEADAGGAT